jgi:uncharacterized protein YjaG (DUF416 family)
MQAMGGKMTDTYGKKSVSAEEMRERAARVCEDSVKWWPNRNMNECEKNPLELAKAIRELPIEPV